MKKKVLSLLLASAMISSLLAGCGGAAAEPAQPAAEETAEPAAEDKAEEAPAAGEAEEEKPSATVGDGGSGEIKVWVADAVVDFTAKQVEKFMADNPDYAGFKVSVEAVGEGDAAGSNLYALSRLRRMVCSP